MKKILLTLPVIAILSACVTTQSTTEENTTAQSTQYSDQWTANLANNKNVLRSCIISNKDIQAIMYMDTKPNATVLTVSTKNGAILDCSVNPQTNKVISITPRVESFPQNISKFYPVGKRLPNTCKGKETIRDDEDRLMGTVCY